MGTGSKITLATVWLAALTVIAIAQDGGRPGDPLARARRYELFLERSPFHEQAFDGWFESVVEADELDASIARLRERLASEPESLAARVRLVRALDRAGEPEAALALLEVRGLPARGAGLAARLALELGDPARALDVLSEVYEKDEEPALELAELRATALVELGRDEEADALLRALGPAQAARAAELAEALRLDDATVALRRIQLEGAPDVERRARCAVELGRVLTRLGQDEDARAALEQAESWLARGHWLAREVEELLFELHDRAGTLEQRAAQLEARVDDDPNDLGAREALARVELARGRPDAALAELESAARDFPADLALTRRRAAVLAELERHDERAAVLQRAAAHHPRDEELAFELAAALLDAQHEDAAERRWLELAERRPGDAELCVRVASAFLERERLELGVAWIERALERDVRALASCAALLRELAEGGASGLVARVFERARELAGDDPEVAAVLAALCMEHRAWPDAAEALEAQLALEPDDVDARVSFARCLRELGDPEAEERALRAALDGARDAAERTILVSALASVWAARDELEERCGALEVRWKESSLGFVETCLLAEAAARDGRDELAHDVLTELVAARPEELELRVRLARGLARRGSTRLALAQYDELAERAPERRREFLLAGLRLALNDRSRRAVLRRLEPLQPLARQDPALLRELAQAYEQVGELEEAKRCLLRARRLEPGDRSTRMELARLYALLRETERAVALWEALWREHGADERDRALSGLTQALRQGRGSIAYLRVGFEALESGRAANWRIELMSELWQRQGIPCDAQSLRRMAQPELADDALLARAAIFVRFGWFARATDDYRELYEQDSESRAEVLDPLLRLLARSGEDEEMARLLGRAAHPVRIADLLIAQRQQRAAVRVLERALVTNPELASVPHRLAALHASLDEPAAAIAAFELAIERFGPQPTMLRELARLHHAVGDRQGALEWALRLYRLDDGSESLMPLFESLDLGDEWRAEEARVGSDGR